MLKAIEDKKRIEEYYDILSSSLRGLGGERMSVRLSYRSGGEAAEVVWVDGFEFWFELNGLGSNAFGTSKPTLAFSNPIDCEMNFSGEGIDRRLGGVFAEGLDGAIYVIHRGRIGGGRKNIGRKGFISSFAGKLVEFIDGTRISTGVPVVRLGAESLPSHLSFFIHEVNRFKEDIVVDKRYADVVVPKRFFVPRYLSRWSRESPDPVDESFEHGLVICTLSNILIDRGLRVETELGNDLTTFGRSGSVKALYEVETRRSPSRVHAALGRLISVSRRLKGRVRKVLVLPMVGTYSKSWRGLIESDAKILGVRILRYRIAGGRVHFLMEGGVLH